MRYKLDVNTDGAMKQGADTVNITQFAEQNGRSRATVYRAAKAAGIDINAIRGADGELTTEGISVLASLFDEMPETQKRTSQCDTKSNGTDSVANDVAARQIEALQMQLDAARKENELLRAALERAQLESDRWHEAATMILPAAHPVKKGLLERIRSAFSGKDGLTE